MEPGKHLERYQSFHRGRREPSRGREEKAHKEVDVDRTIVQANQKIHITNVRGQIYSQCLSLCDMAFKLNVKLKETIIMK